MSRFIKVVSNEVIKIEEYKNPRVCFNNTEYDDIENYCVLRATINPFQMRYKNKELQQRIDKAIPMLDELEKKIQETLSFKIPIKEIKQIKEILKGGVKDES